MTTISQYAAQPAAPNQFGHLVRRLGLWACAAATRWEYRAATKTLRDLNDRELRDIGLGRGDIEGAVRGTYHPEMGRF